MVDHDVRAAAGELLDDRNDVVLVVIECGVGTELARPLQF